MPISVIMIRGKTRVCLNDKLHWEEVSADSFTRSYRSVLGNLME